VKGRRCAVAVIALLSTACAGLPPKEKPVRLSSAAPLDGLEAAGGGGWPAAQWWKRYQDPTLDRLIELAVASSPTLASAHARFDSARQSVRIAGAASGVRVDASADIDRQRLSDNGLFPPRLLGFTWYNQSDLGLRPRTPSTGGANSATLWKPPWTRRMRRKRIAAPRR
jgi:multidrug efflux system outer membrane protein